MPEPPIEYTNALNNLKAFRSKIFNDLVGGRVKASLDAQHESMQRYAGVMDNLGVTPYLMGYIRHMVVGLQFKGMNAGAGALRDVRVEYVGDETDYPTNPPFSVPQRKLPQVDYFQFTPTTDIDLLNTTNLASLKSALLIQAPSGTFRDKPDVENALYDYYTVYPNVKRRGDWTMSGVNAFFGPATKISGENIRCLRELIKDDTGERYTYILILWLDSMLRDGGAYVNPFAIACAISGSVEAPNITFNIVGQRIEYTAGGVWGATKYSDALRGFARVCTGVEEDANPVTMWMNTWKLTMEVNDPAMGRTVPAVGEYTYEAMMGVQFYAYAHAGYKFDHWERDGVLYSTVTPYSVQMYKDYKIKAVFVPV